MHSRKPSLLIIFLTVFIDLIGFGIVLPLLPRYSERYGAEGWMIGLIIASFSVMQLLLAPFWGRLSDRVGRRPILLLSNGGSALAYAMFGWSAMPGWSADTALALIVLSRLFAGACGANISVASAYIADITPPEQRSRGMALIGVAFGMGFILGPAIGALSAAAFGLAGPGWVAAGLCTANFALACLILVESRSADAPSAPARPRLAQWRHTLSRGPLALPIGLYFLATLCFASFESMLPLLVGSPSIQPRDLLRPVEVVERLREAEDPAIARFRARASAAFLDWLETPGVETSPALRPRLSRELNRWLHSDRDSGQPDRDAEPSALRTVVEETRPRRDPRTQRIALESMFPGAIRSQTLYFEEKRLGYVFAFCGLIAALVQGAVGRLVTRLGEPRLIFLSLVLFAVSLAWLPFADSLVGLFTALALISGASGISRAPTIGLISRRTPAHEQGSTLGIAQSAATLGRIIGPITATTLYAVDPRIAFLTAAGLALLAGVVAWIGLVSRAGTAPTAEGIPAPPAPPSP